MEAIEIEKLNQIVSRTDINGNEKVEMLISFTENYHNLQLHKTQVSGSFINNVENLTNSILKCFPKFFDDFENWEYGTGTNAGKDFHKMYKIAKRLKAKIGKNYR